MVERLKEAIEKARAQRAQLGGAPPPGPPGMLPVGIPRPQGQTPPSDLSSDLSSDQPPGTPPGAPPGAPGASAQPGPLPLDPPARTLAPQGPPPRDPLTLQAELRRARPDAATPVDAVVAARAKRDTPPRLGPANGDLAIVDRTEIAAAIAAEFDGDPTLDAPLDAPFDTGRPGGRGGVDWRRLAPMTLATERLQRRRVITLDRSDPAHTAFDVLRSRIIKAFKDNGWKRLAITSPTKGCGKTFVSANLALSFARQPDMRTLLIDMDLRAPNVANTLGQRDRMAIRNFLTGSTPAETYLRRLGDNLAVALNTERVRDAAELILERRTASVLERTVTELAPDMVIYDLPPMLVSDDAFAFLPQVDAVLLVAAAGETRAAQIEACEQLFTGDTAFLGVLLNKVEESAEEGYGYGYS